MSRIDKKETPADSLSPQRRGQEGCDRIERRSLHILIVDDNEDHTILVRRALKQRGHQVTVVHNGKGAVQELAQGNFDVIALDYQLPDTTGLKVLEDIKSHASNLPVVMVTASGSEKVAVNALKSGANDYVVKSLGYERELIRALEMAAETARARAAEAILRAELELRATTDPLTGLLNRGEMEAVISRELHRAGRYNRAFAFALIDVDDFKQINDTFGHPTGDIVLKHIAQMLTEAMRASDSVARWGGDEFAVFLPDTEFSGARGFYGRLREIMNATRDILPQKSHVRLTLSVGFVIGKGSNLGEESLLKSADRALYAAKQAGRARARYLVIGDRASMDSPSQEVGAAAGADKGEEHG